jgi:hypothetical protein
MTSRWIPISILAVVGCTREQATETSVEPSKEPAEIAATVQHDGEEVENAAARIEAHEEKSAPSAGACKGDRPGWLDLGRCEAGGMIYAAGSASGIRDLSLARASAASHARESLLGKKQGRIEKSEVIDVFACGHTVFALARMPSSEGASLPRCDAEKIADRRATEGRCPAWTRQIVKKEGDQISAVGLARMKNRALAQATAANRARAEMVRYVGLDVSGDGQHANGRAYTEVSRQQAFCEDYVWVMLVGRELEDVQHAAGH